MWTWHVLCKSGALQHSPGVRISTQNAWMFCTHAAAAKRAFTEAIPPFIAAGWLQSYSALEKGELLWEGKHIFWLRTNANLYAQTRADVTSKTEKCPEVSCIYQVLHWINLLSQLFGVFLAWDNNRTNPILPMHVQLRSAELTILN